MADPKKVDEAQAQVIKASDELSDIELERASGGTDAKPQPQPFLKFEFKSVFTTKI
jgi:hypothetical protein